MDGKLKPGIGVPTAEMPEIRPGDQKVRRTNRGLVVTVIVLAVAVVGLGVALIAATQKEEGGLLSGAHEWLINEFTAAVNRSDGAAAAALFAEDGVIRLADGTVYEGRSEIEAYVHGLPPMDYTRVGELSGDASRATGTFSYSSAQGAGTVTREFTFASGDDVASVTESGDTGGGGAGTESIGAAGAAGEHTAAIEGVMTALNEGDARAAADYYAEDALFTYWGGELVGRDAVAGFFKNVVVPNGWNLQVLGPMIGYGDVVAAVVYVEDESGALMTYLNVYTFDGAGHIHDQLGMQELGM
jgi:ketosteroid isomerase-like protein